MKQVALLSFMLSVSIGALVTKERQTALEAGEACDDEPYWCAAGLSCVGEEGNRKCFRKRSRGEKCGLDPFWMCEDSLSCQNSTCVFIGHEGDRCNGSTAVCAGKLRCIGNEGDTKCFMKQYKGGLCPEDEPFWVCREELSCVNGVCKQVNIMEGGECNTDNEVCADGLHCIGEPWRRNCFRKQGLGEACPQEDPYFVCEQTLSCVDELCVRVVGEGEDCGEEDVLCEHGLQCVGDNGARKCFAGRAEGERCGLDPFWACAPPLRCAENGVCVS
ncbi:hypothetical protein BWQ96_00354 [Gracilariopsis chorda]|uniref:Tenascin-X n=1 Tax=Gracilariopsis chorda TaxID=448386 RepID=A0A2V3J6E7_9FLOR|nr:hypothetical protein BWQ96_00354 [Gracilariopsis chorda]|eukprot:PXF49702.1 hypothetical protein BWQ96_00354 [Gracilariopsis chorda]